MKTNLDNNFTYHPPVGGDVAVYAALRATAKSFARMLTVNCPPSRELALALTKLEESVMWANAARARYDEHGTPKIKGGDDQ